MNETNRHTVNVSISLPPRLRDAARKAAFDDNRSFSSLVAWLLNQHLKQDGYLEERRPPFHMRNKQHVADCGIFFNPQKTLSLLETGSSR